MNETKNNFHFWLLLAILLAGGVFVHWRELAGETKIERKPLRELSENLGKWEKFGKDERFQPEVESILRADDYLMRDYYLTGTTRAANIYVGYYHTQRTGATYHSPRNCLPGSGWTMTQPELIEISLPDGRKFTANRYFVQNEKDKLMMIYWYQGRGRFAANEYADKVLTVWDSIARRRSDGALVRVVTPIENSEKESIEAAIDLSAQLAVNLTDFVPD